MPNFFPHRVCLLGNQHLIAVDIISDTTIALSYFVIAWVLSFVASRPERLARLLGFIAATGSWVLRTFAGQFGLFILACGCTHVVNVWTMWQGVYYVDAVARVITAALSIRTAIAIVKLTRGFMAQERQEHR
jgi:hypothetical protein